MKGNARGSGYDRVGSDYYVEPRRSIDALLEVERFSSPLWDPCCGGGNIVKACRQWNYRTLASDIVDRGCPDSFVLDFLTFSEELPQPPTVIMNPPFTLATEFVVHALTFAPKVVLIQRTAWLEGQRRYQMLFERKLLARVWQFSSRISMPPGGTEVTPHGGSVAYAWFVFERGHKGPAALDWLP